MQTLAPLRQGLKRRHRMRRSPRALRHVQKPSGGAAFGGIFNPRSGNVVRTFCPDTRGHYRFADESGRRDTRPLLGGGKGVGIGCVNRSKLTYNVDLAAKCRIAPDRVTRCSLTHPRTLPGGESGFATPWHPRVHPTGEPHGISIRLAINSLRGSEEAMESIAASRLSGRPAGSNPGIALLPN